MMCNECKRAADQKIKRHPCESPTSCTCLHNGKPVVHR